jgi:hypothetical protein
VNHSYRLCFAILVKGLKSSSTFPKYFHNTQSNIILNDKMRRKLETNFETRYAACKAESACRSPRYVTRSTRWSRGMHKRRSRRRSEEQISAGSGKRSFYFLRRRIGDGKRVFRDFASFIGYLSVAWAS